MSIKPSNPCVVCFSLMLEHEKYFGAEKSKLWKEESSHWSQNMLQGKYSNELLGTMGEKIVCVPLQKQKKKRFSGRFPFYYTHTHTHTHICHHIYQYVLLHHHLSLTKYDNLQWKEDWIFDLCVLCPHKLG